MESGHTLKNAGRMAGGGCLCVGCRKKFKEWNQKGKNKSGFFVGQSKLKVTVKQNCQYDNTTLKFIDKFYL